MLIGRRVFFEWREFGRCCVRAPSTCWESEQQLLDEREAGGRERSIVSSGLGTAEESNHFQITLLLKWDGFALETLTPSEMSLRLSSLL